jgi:hypothetical protein
MAMMTVGKLPGKKDINNQYSRVNMHKTMQYYNSIKNPTTGDYVFGELTNLWYPNTPWMSDLEKVYPPDAQNKIKGFVIEALNNKAKNGQDDPIPFLITWTKDNSTKQDVTRSYDPFTITILNYAEPPSSALDERKQK